MSHNRTTETDIQMLLPARFSAGIAGAPTLPTWYQAIPEAVATPGQWDLAWLSEFATGDAVAELLRNGERLRWVHYSPTGVEHLPLELFLAKDVLLTNGAGLYAQPIAEHVVMCVLAARLNLIGLLRSQAAAAWEPEVESEAELSGSVALILGYGELGRAIATRLMALGVTVLGARRSGPIPEGDGVVPANNWRDRLPDADFVIMTLPSTRETHGVVGPEELAAMKSGAWLVNVARGNLVDEPALVEGLSSGHLGGAILDAFVQEPLPPEHPLWRLPNVIISPHSSWRSSRLGERQLALFNDNLGRFLAGKTLRNIVDPVAGY